LLSLKKGRCSHDFANNLKHIIMQNFELKLITSNEVRKELEP